MRNYRRHRSPHVWVCHCLRGCFLFVLSAPLVEFPALDFRRRILAGELKFDEVAQRESDCSYVALFIMSFISLTIQISLRHTRCLCVALRAPTRSSVCTLPFRVLGFILIGNDPCMIERPTQECKARWRPWSLWPQDHATALRRGIVSSQSCH